MSPEQKRKVALSLTSEARVGKPLPERQRREVGGGRRRVPGKPVLKLVNGFALAFGITHFAGDKYGFALAFGDPPSP